MVSSAREITQLLLAWGEGDGTALDRLIPLVYAELHQLARGYMRKERSGHSLQPTALVHEAYQKLIDASRVPWQNRAHFFGVSAQIMRHILVDMARSRRSRKRAVSCQVMLDDDLPAYRQRGRDLVALDDALSALSAIDPRKGQVVELRFFGGLSAEESAEVLGVSPQTVLRDWRLAKAWLMRELDHKRDTR
ncbi:MAG: sigma-70 family RNA polymerase sigma factor [Bryobacteraceae bacterium]